MTKEKKIIESRLRSLINETVIFINEETAMVDSTMKLYEDVQNYRKNGKNFEEIKDKYIKLDQDSFKLQAILQPTIAGKVASIVELNTVCEMMGILPEMDETSKNFLKNVMQGSLSLYVIKNGKVEFSDSAEAQMYLQAMQQRADQSQDQMKTAYESIEV